MSNQFNIYIVFCFLGGGGGGGGGGGEIPGPTPPLYETLMGN